MKRTKGRNTRHPQVKADAVKILRTLEDPEAFYFYEDIGKPTGQAARSLQDFIEKANTVKLESLTFHLQRRDFQNWVEKILGDTRLARQLGEIHPTNGEDARTKINETVANRVKELKESTATILVEQNSTLVLPSY